MFISNPNWHPLLMHSNRCLGAKTGAGAQKTFDRDKTSSCHPNWAHPLPTQLINELSLSWIQMALSYWGLWAPIHNTFLMSFDVELPFFATFLPPFLYLFPDANGRMIRFVFVTIFCLFFAFCLPTDPSLGGRLAKSLFMILLFPEWNQINWNPPPSYFMTDQNCHNLVNCCQRGQKQGLLEYFQP